MNRLFPVALASILLFTGCVTTQQSRTAEAGPRQELARQAEQYNGTVLEGAAIGATVGAVAGLVAGGDERAAAVGALIGGLIGAGAGKVVADKKQQAAATEDSYDQMITAARAQNEQLGNIIATSERVLADNRSRVAAIKTDMADAGAKRKASAAQIAVLQDDVKLVRTMIQTSEKGIQRLREEVDGLKRKDPAHDQAILAQSLSEMEAKRARLVSIEAEYKSMINSLTTT